MASITDLILTVLEKSNRPMTRIEIMMQVHTLKKNRRNLPFKPRSNNCYFFNGCLASRYNLVSKGLIQRTSIKGRASLYSLPQP